MLHYFPLILFCVSTSLTPGPNNLMIMNSGLEFGISRSLSHYLGICLGFALLVFLVAMGMGQLFLQFSWIKPIMSVFGSLYMLYLAIQIYMSKPSELNSELTKKPWSFLKAIAFQWINPKGWLMALGVIMVFSMSKNLLLNALLLSGTFFIICSPCIAVWLFFGHYLKHVLTSEKQRKLFNHVMAIGLFISIILIWV